MHAYGGLYLDLDVECHKLADASLQNFDVLLQGMGNDGLSNAMMASTPGKESWNTCYSPFQFYARN